MQGFTVHRVAGAHPLTLRHRLPTWRNVLRGGVGALAVRGVAVSGWLVLTNGRASEWDVVAGVAEIERLAGEAKYAEAHERAQRLDRRIRNDSIREAMWALVSVTATIESTSAGARVFMHNYAPAGAEWKELERTPLAAVRIPLGMQRLRLERPGYRTWELAVQAAALPSLGSSNCTLNPRCRRACSRSSYGYGLFAEGSSRLLSWTPWRS